MDRDQAHRVQPAPTDTAYLDRPDGRIAYDVAGHGRLVVCLPGMGELRSSYRHTRPALVAAGFRVATMDLRGHGDSDTTFTTYDDVAAGGDALALVDHLGGPAVLIGNSMSAGAAVWAAAERPQLVTGLVLIGPFVRNVPMNPLLGWIFRVAMSGPCARRVWVFYLPKLSPGPRPDDYDEHLGRHLRQPGQARPDGSIHRDHPHQPRPSRSPARRRPHPRPGRHGLTRPRLPRPGGRSPARRRPNRRTGPHRRRRRPLPPCRRPGHRQPRARRLPHHHNAPMTSPPFARARRPGR